MKYIILEVNDNEEIKVINNELIPMEWIKRYCYINNVSLKSPIETMLKKWEKENDKQRNK